jgi:hypothetical protein
VGGWRENNIPGVTILGREGSRENRIGWENGGGWTREDAEEKEKEVNIKYWKKENSGSHNFRLSRIERDSMEGPQAAKFSPVQEK